MKATDPELGVSHNKEHADNRYAKLINDRIKNLSLKLLDSTRRNPLISTKFSDRSNSLIRIVDEVPELMLESILSEEMRIVPLPDLDTPLKDENTREFQDALAEARVNDEIYLNKLDEIDQEGDEAPNLLAEAERELKDRLRQQLNMPPRQTKNNLSLQQHAKNHGIFPHYELPFEDQKYEDGRHTDKDIQTLLLPDVMTRRLNALFTKEKTWKEEAGISVLHAAFGFLEWEDGNNSSVQFSPLILIPVQLEKRRTRNGQEFWIRSDEGDIQTNKVLAEKLRIEFNMVLPEYTDQGLEKYFKEINEQKPANMFWKVRRWASIGVFPSARLAMYYDLDPSQWDFSAHPIISNLFGGYDAKYEAAPFAKEYDVDEPLIESKVPYLIADADSSQFSAIVDVADGKNIAIEGPPGTGKSQTIVNTIAALLSLGKKVLFVAEKSAALEVVRSRLEAFGIGNYLLPLQANRSGKEQIISSIRNRLEMKPCENPSELDYAVKQFKKARQELKVYIDILSAPYGETDFTIYTILGRSIKLSDMFNELPNDIKNFSFPDIKKINSDKFKNILSLCSQVENAWHETLNCSDCWRMIKLPNIDPYLANDLLDLADMASNLFKEAYEQREHLSIFKISPSVKLEILSGIEDAIKLTSKSISNEDLNLLVRLSNNRELELINEFLEQLELWKEKKNIITQDLSGNINTELLEKLLQVKEFLGEYDILLVDDEELKLLIKKRKELVEKFIEIKKIFDQSARIFEPFGELSLFDFIKAINLISGLSQAALIVRRKELNDPSIQIFFERQVEKVNLLLEEKKSLDEDFILSTLPAPEEIHKHVLVFSCSGLFSFLSTDYRRSKKFYKSISKNKKFKRKIAVEKVRELSDWSARSHDVFKSKEFCNILGLHLEGINTDFIPFQEVISFFRQIEQNFQGLEYSELRNFLKHGDNEKIKSLSMLDIEYSIDKLEDISLKNLNEKILFLKEDLNKCEFEVKRFQEFKSIFKTPQKICNNFIDDIIKKLEIFLALSDSLRNNTSIKDILGTYYKGELTSKAEFQEILNLATKLAGFDVEDKNAFFYSIQANILQDLSALIARVKECDSKAYASINKIANMTKSAPERWLEGGSYLDFSKMMRFAAKDKTGLLAYSKFIFAKNNLQQYNCHTLVESIISNDYKNICEIVEAVIICRMAKQIYTEHAGELTKYNGSHLNYLRERLQKFDREIIELSRQRLQSQLYSNASPPSGVGFGRKSEYIELALLKHEVSKKKRYISIRSLTRRATKALLELKPCWMMSPLAVAQYLPKGEVEFDLVIIDEASQMTPEDSVGALIRAKQAMVVGDTHQLPPTTFFRKVLDDESTDEDEKVTEESILEMANVSFESVRRLRWHYRSRHSGLISFSNKHIYKNDLVVFPSPQEDRSDMGVSYVKVDGIYSSRTNSREAKVMVDSIIDFMKRCNNKSLGVVLLNQKQRDLLSDEMNYVLEQNPCVRDYIEKWEEKNDGLESFFIKNLENVQGDERDVIFIGTVYGAEKEGAHVMQRFGPINGIAGKRRLNVLFSRAKEQIVTFSSMSSSDIRAEEDGNQGAYMLKCWLEYAASGILERGCHTEKEPDSAFEEHVIQQIRSIGCEAVPQVGVKGYSIDIGVKHPNWPHGYIMGVECDGATYHSSRSARDRDRLRQEILEGLKWKLYRIWSTDWFENPKAETEKLRIAIKNRLEELLCID